MSILLQPSKIHSSFVEGRNLAESHEVNSRASTDLSGAGTSFRDPGVEWQTFSPFERRIAAQSLTEYKAYKQEIHRFGSHFLQKRRKENIIVS